MSRIRSPQPAPQKTNPSPPVRGFLPAAFLLILLGGGGFAYIVLYVSPSGGARWAFFFTAVLGLTGVALPVMAFFNRRFPSDPPVTPGIVLRQAIWAGVYFPTLAWLQLGRLLTPILALVLGVGLIFIESMLRLRERAEWEPGGSDQ